MSYRRLAKFCGVGAAGISAAFSVTMMVITFGLGYLPIAIAVAIVAGSLAYLTIWLVWTLNQERLTRQGHHW